MAEADRGSDLLFGVIALQMNFITQAQFVEVMTLLPSSPGKSAEELFAEKGYLNSAKVEALQGLLKVQLEEHGGDVDKSIAAFGDNPAVQQTMVLIGEEAPDQTIAFTDASAVPAPIMRAGDDRYLLGKELGRGGLGKVVIALDRNFLSREVAMKLMLPDHGWSRGGRVTRYTASDRAVSRGSPVDGSAPAPEHRFGPRHGEPSRR